MSLSVELNGCILHVTYSNGFDRVEHWYYDLLTWRRSMYGRENDAPAEPMRQEQIDWAKQYWIPKLSPIPKAEAYRRSLYISTVHTTIAMSNWSELEWIEYLDIENRWLVPVKE